MFFFNICSYRELAEETFFLHRSYSKKNGKIIPWSSSPVRLSGQKIFEEKFSPFQWTGRWKLATNGGSWQHFYTHLNALKTARIESREDSKTLTVAEIGENGVFL